ATLAPRRVARQKTSVASSQSQQVYLTERTQHQVSLQHLVSRGGNPSDRAPNMARDGNRRFLRYSDDVAVTKFKSDKRFVYPGARTPTKPTWRTMSAGDWKRHVPDYPRVQQQTLLTEPNNP
ncbi:hypothetical protein C0J52_06870, partial [Blattella germanica]